ncbi:MAG: rhodanese-like domain-containing protein [Planctomycetes bacterium]|nr:rhodanese-like domain-containing protein [Planctomycetota bacterium]
MKMLTAPSKNFTGLMALAFLGAIGCSAGKDQPVSAVKDGPRDSAQKSAEESAEQARLDREYEELVRGFNRKTGARAVTVAEVRKRFAAGENILFLDIREPEENAVAALPGARLIPPSKVREAALDFPAGATLMTYCTAGYRSGLAAVELEKRLQRPVYNLSGGIIAWFNAGGEVVGPAGKPADRIHPYSDEWGRYVRPRQGDAR